MCENIVKYFLFLNFISLVNVYYDFESFKWLDGETHQERFKSNRQNQASTDRPVINFCGLISVAHMEGWMGGFSADGNPRPEAKTCVCYSQYFQKKIWCEPHLKEIPHERWLTSESDSMWPVQPFTPIYLIAGLGFIQDENSEYFPSIPKDHLNQISEEIENNIKEKFWKIRVTIFFQSQRSYRFSK